PAPVAVSNIDQPRDDIPILPAQRILSAILQEELAVAGAVELVGIEIDVCIARTSEDPRVRDVVEIDVVVCLVIRVSAPVVVVDDKSDRLRSIVRQPVILPVLR